MKILGWIIWGFGCLWLLINLTGVAKQRGRKLRLVFCFCAGAGLIVTAFTTLSKIHLLWILLLPFSPYILAFVTFGGLDGPMLRYQRILGRLPKRTKLPAQSYPPFEELYWGNSESWEGKICIPDWVGFQSRGGAYGFQDSDSPSNGVVPIEVNPGEDAEKLTPNEAQCRAVKILVEQENEVLESILGALLPHYREVKRDSEADDEYMPPISSVDDFRKMMGLSRVYVRPYAADGIAYIGLELGCDWEDEHGLGIVIHGARVVEIGEADVAFSWRPDEQQSSTKPSN